MKLSQNSTLEKTKKYTKVIFGCIVAILVMLGLFLFWQICPMISVHQ